MSDISAPPPPTRPVDPKREPFGRSLRRLRERRGLTMVALAVVLDEGPPSTARVSDIERGLHGARYPSIREIGGILGVLSEAGAATYEIGDLFREWRAGL